MSLHVLADHMASKGRNGDSVLVHMTPHEVAGLQALAMKHGGTLTINPDTGLPEANFLKSLLPMIAGFALGPAGLGLTIGGLSSAATAGLLVGGATGLATGSLSRGLMAGLGAYGGAGLAEGLAGAGTSAGLNEAMAGSAPSTTAQIAGDTLPAVEGSSGQAFNEYLKSNANPATMTGTETLSAGAKAAMDAPGTFLKDNLKYIGAAAAPIAADMMVPTTTKMPTPTDTGYIRQKVFDPGSQTYRDLTPVKAADWGSRSFSDIYRGYNNGGIVALAAGGTGQTVEDLYASIGNTKPDAEGLAFWKSNFGEGPVTADQAASFMQSANAVLSKLPPSEQMALAPTLAANNAVTGGNYGNTLATAGQNTANIADTSGGLSNLATANVADTSGINTLTGGATGKTSTADAQAAVNNIYRNVLGRDADATGLNFWSNAIANGRSVDSVYQDILKSANEIKQAGTLGDFGIKTMSVADATKPYTGFTSAEGSTIADEWVRNTLGREPTDADRAQSWYKDVANLGTSTAASRVYGDFTKYATKETSAEIANRIRAIDAELKAKGLTDADLLKQTGKTKQQLAEEGLNTGLGFMAASQLAPAASRTGFDLTALKKLTPLTNTFGGTAIDRTVTNPYGNETNPGDLTYNRDGSITVTPNIPYRPYAGFSGSGEVKNAWTQGGGSLGYTSPVVKTAAEHEALYNKQTGDSLAAYNYLMGKGAYPTKSGVGEIMKPYKEATLGYPTSTNKAYNYDTATGRMVRNPDYVATGRDSSGNVTYGMSLNDIRKYLGTSPLQGQALYDWAKTNNLSAQDIADATGMSLSDVYTQFRTGQAASKAAADKKAADAAATGVANADYSGAAGGGLQQSYAMGGYAVGGGLGSLGSYSDGGRLLKGPGDGVSDSIPATIGAKQQPARLADGEFVVPARIVSELGNGSTDAGAKKLYAMMDRVQKARGKTTGKNKVAANSRADKYLPA